MKTEADAGETLEELARVRSETRHMLDFAWFGYLVFGVLCLGAAVLGALSDDGEGSGIYWLTTTPLAIVIVWQYYERRESELGIFARHEGLSAIVVLAMLAGAFSLGFLADGELSAVGTLVPIGLGLLAFYALYRDPIDGLAGAAIGLVVITLLLVEPGDPAPLAMLGEGTVLILAALAGRLRRERYEQQGTVTARALRT